MLDDIVQVIHHLHEGDRKGAEPLLDSLKIKAIYFDEKIQQDVLIFAEQIYFQFDYDPWHKVTPEVQKSADNLIAALGFSNPLR
ncbi:MAG TPA: hypothetical protein VLF94_07795 [Chlamydiales bacterium]|nr:hypothetical protein [Chlamydiales bacterium]